MTKIIISKAKDRANAMPQISLLQWKTFHPSSMPTGIRLKTAMKALMYVLNKATSKKANPAEKK